ncbi:MAG: MBL fold metallo-hydrolase [Clostridiales bacterium]|nr:MBL fold metallo-hydrolase [Clostridiales bacterium]
MEKIIISSNLTQYRLIETLDRVTYYTSSFLYHHKGQGVLIDSGYGRLGQFIKDDLEQSKIILNAIVITHYHKDHAEGSTVFNEIPIIASDQYEDTFYKCQNVCTQQLKIPNVLVKDKYFLTVDTSRIEIFKTPGHTKCGLSVLINNEYLYVSDNLLEDINNKIIVPYLDASSNPYDHYKTIYNYQNLKFHTLLLTHGPIKENVNLTHEFGERLFYLETFIKSKFSCNIEDCLLTNIENYSMTAIHKINVRNAKKHVSIQPTSFFEPMECITKEI